MHYFHPDSRLNSINPSGRKSGTKRIVELFESSNYYFLLRKVFIFSLKNSDRSNFNVRFIFLTIRAIKFIAHPR